MPDQVATHERLAELLHEIGWRDTHDAQWVKLQNYLPQIAEVLCPKPVARLTRSDELFIAERLLARARHRSKQLTRAEVKPVHPELLRQIHEDVAQCTRLAGLLQAGASETVSGES